MQFLYHDEAGLATLTLTGEAYKYLFKVRRFELGKTLGFRNLKDDTVYQYQIESIRKKEATLFMIDSFLKVTSPQKMLHILWCIIEPKVIEKTLPMLNQLGVSKISFLYCERSQKSFKIDLERMKKILINSSQQCGRSDLMVLEVLDSLDVAMGQYPDFSLVDFGGELIVGDARAIMIGCEGGFSEAERLRLSKHKKIGLDTSLILKSETVAVTFASKLLI